MVESWTRALMKYCWPVDFAACKYSNDFDFREPVDGKQESTARFETHFRERARTSPACYVEVAYWKMYSRGEGRHFVVDIIKQSLDKQGEPTNVWQSIERFVSKPDLANFRAFRELLGIRSPVLAVASTFPAFVAPAEFPIVDTRVARWVNDHWASHSENRKCSLQPFSMKYSSLQDNDFYAYLSWVYWCRETATILSERRQLPWRARDVEMAVFVAAGHNPPLVLDPLVA